MYLIWGFYDLKPWFVLGPMIPTRNSYRNSQDLVMSTVTKDKMLQIKIVVLLEGFTNPTFRVGFNTNNT